MATPSAEPNTHWIAALWLAPFTASMTMLECWGNLTDSWCKTVFSPAYHHAHDHHVDLEVPDPIEEDGEHDLFA